MNEKLILIFIVIVWLFIAITNSTDFDWKSVMIWLATIMITLSQIQIYLLTKIKNE